jgi:20S proteasome alpha/beta subunit
MPISEKCVICRSGSAAVTQNIGIAAQIKNNQRYHRYGTSATSVSQTAHWLRQVVYNNDDSSSSGRLVSLLVAGYDDEKFNNGNDSTTTQHHARIFSISPSGVLLQEQRYAALGSGSTYAMTYLDEQLQKDQTTAVDEKRAKKLCQRAIELAIHRDASSGGLIRMHVIDATGRREFVVHPQQQTSGDTAKKKNSGNSRQTLPGFAVAAEVHR